MPIFYKPNLTVTILFTVSPFAGEIIYPLAPSGELDIGKSALQTDEYNPKLINNVNKYFILPLLNN
jgi:hypothetical protein